MRRIMSACLLQTMKFDTTNDTNPEEDLEIFLKKLEKKRTKYVIESKKKEADGSIILKIKKQYNNYETTDYLD